MASSASSAPGGMEAGAGREDFGPLTPGRSLMDLFTAFQTLGVETRTEIYHEKGLRHGLDGIFCKNLLLKDRKGQFYYIICYEDWKVDLKLLKCKLNAHRNFSFASSAEVDNLLSLQPGNISPFGFLNNPDSAQIRLVIDSGLTTNAEKLNFHPLVSQLTTLLSFTDLERFLSFCHVEYETINID